MRHHVLVVVAVGLLVAAGAIAPAKPPPGPPRTLPGALKGRVETRWLAPLVSVTRRTVGVGAGAGAGATTTVQWLAPNGAPVRELSGANVDAQPGYVLVLGKAGNTVHAVNGDWQFTLAARGEAPGYLTATEDSRTFLHQFHPREGEVAIDVHIAGKRVGTVGPFAQYQGQGVELGADGSFACLTWNDDGAKKPQVVVAGPDGRQRFRVDCDGPAIAPAPAPGGAGVLVRVNDGGTTFTCYTAAGKGASLELGPNAGLLTWLPGTLKAVMHTSVGPTYRFQLVDWASGKILWEIADPLAPRVVGALPAVATLGDHVLFAGREWRRLGEHEEAVRTLCALDAATGRVTARWQPEPLQPARHDGRFLRLGEELYLVTDDEFAAIAPADIAARANGWQ